MYFVLLLLPFTVIWLLLFGLIYLMKNAQKNSLSRVPIPLEDALRAAHAREIKLKKQIKQLRKTCKELYIANNSADK